MYVCMYVYIRMYVCLYEWVGQNAATLGSAWTPEEHKGDDARSSRTVRMCASYYSSVLYRGQKRHHHLTMSFWFV